MTNMRKAPEQGGQTRMSAYERKLMRSKIEGRVLKFIRENHTRLYSAIRENVVAQLKQTGERS